MDRLLSELLLLVEPVGLTWLGLLVMAGVALRRRRWGWAAASASLGVVLFVAGGTGLGGSLVKSLEAPYAGWDYRAAATADAIVMLGGGIEPSRYEVGGFHLTRAGDRVLMALELARRGKAPVLVLGGGGAMLHGQKRVESEVLRAWMEEAGLAAGAELVSLPRCRNTHDEALRVRELAAQRGWKRVLLVTSANHLRRASATFAAAGVAVEPAPCNFLTTLSTSAPEEGWRPGVPTWGGMEKISVWLHETVGWYEYRRRGWL